LAIKDLIDSKHRNKLLCARYFQL